MTDHGRFAERAAALTAELGETDGGAPYRDGGGDLLDQAARLYELGRCEWFLARFDAAERHLGRALSLREELLPANDPLVIDARERVAALLHYQGRDADAQFRQVVAARVAVHGNDALETAVARRNHGTFLRDQGHGGAATRLEQAERTLLEVGGDEHPDYAAALKARALLLVRGEPPFWQAFEVAERAYEVSMRVHPDDHPFVGGALLVLGRAHAALDEHAAARRVFDQARTNLEGAYGLEHPLLAFVAEGLGTVAYTDTDFDGAIAQWRRSVEIYERTYPSTPYGARMRLSVTHALLLVGEPELALAEMDAGVARGHWSAEWLQELAERANELGFLQVGHRAAVHAAAIE